ncbi:hypothetical protein [Flavobacterium sp.]|uniref:hypothetical protein n=1 Tax=Flavobacterium sp. TaxID=239 RepID=UPI0025E2CAC1|nr:hypothetical protein [Flavobacterium sp.]
MSHNSFVFNLIWTFLLVIFPIIGIAQDVNLPKAKTGAFWEHVQFGGGLGLSISSDYTDVTIAPGAIYNFNEHFALGTGLQYSNLKQKNYYSANVFGGSLMGLYSPVQEIQLSMELEEINVNSKYQDLGGNIARNFWNTGLFIGGGYRQNNVTIGGRFNVLFDTNKDIYGSAFMPFVRVFF